MTLTITKDDTTVSINVGSFDSAAATAILASHSNFGLTLDNSSDANAARVILERQDFSTRSSFVTWATGKTPTVGLVMKAGGIAYRYTGSGTIISDLPGWVPDGTPAPDHYKENTTPGTTDMTTAFQTAFANHAAVSDVPGSTYLVKGVCNVAFDNADINFERSTIVTTGWDVGDAAPAFASGLINILGTYTKSTTMTGTAAAGATSISVYSGTGIGAGDAIFMNSVGELWYTESTNPCYRSFITRVTSVSGTTVNLAEALPFSFDSGVAQINIATWRGVQGARIAMGTMIGPGYVRPRGNNPGENAICALYAQKLSMTAKKIVGFQGRSIFAQRCIDVQMGGFVQGRPDNYTAAVVEGDNAFWAGFIAVECARVLMSGHASRTRHAVDGTRSWDVHVTTRASDTHQSPYTCHYGCSNWVYEGINYSGASLSQGILLWRGWNFKVLGAYLASTDTSPVIYDTDGTATDLPKTYSIDDCYASGPGDAIDLKSTIKDVKIRGSVIKGATPILIVSDRVEKLDIVGNSIEATSTYAIDANLTPSMYRDWRIEGNNIAGYSTSAARVYAEASQTMLSFQRNFLRPTGTPANHLTKSGTFLHLIEGPNYCADGKVHAPMTAWTPILSDGTNDATMSGNNTGWYRREGGMIHFVARVEITSLGSVTGAVRIKGLPVPMASSGLASAAVPVANAALLTLTAGQSVTGYIAAGTTYIALQVWNGSGGVGTMQGTHWTSTGRIIISGSYPAI